MAEWHELRKYEKARIYLEVVGVASIILAVIALIVDLMHQIEERDFMRQELAAIKTEQIFIREQQEYIKEQRKFMIDQEALINSQRTATQMQIREFVEIRKERRKQKEIDQLLEKWTRNRDTSSVLESLLEIGYSTDKLSFRGKDLRSIDLSDRDLAFVDFRSSLLQCAKFKGANLRNAIFERAILDMAVFDRADMVGANFWETRLVGASFSEVLVENSVRRLTFLNDKHLYEILKFDEEMENQKAKKLVVDFFRGAVFYPPSDAAVTSTGSCDDIRSSRD